MYSSWLDIRVWARLTGSCHQVAMFSPAARTFPRKPIRASLHRGGFDAGRSWSYTSGISDNLYLLFDRFLGSIPETAQGVSNAQMRMFSPAKIKRGAETLLGGHRQDARSGVPISRIGVIHEGESSRRPNGSPTAFSGILYLYAAGCAQAKIAARQRPFTTAASPQILTTLSFMASQIRNSSYWLISLLTKGL
jgi:hypothetical protein